jgi:hypothetical protein
LLETILPGLLARRPAFPHQLGDPLAGFGGHLAAASPPSTSARFSPAGSCGVRRRSPDASASETAAQPRSLFGQRTQTLARLDDLALEATERPSNELGGSCQDILPGFPGSTTRHAILLKQGLSDLCQTSSVERLS